MQVNEEVNIRRFDYVRRQKASFQAEIHQAVHQRIRPRQHRVGCQLKVRCLLLTS